jgi:exodeoxyribonuclease-3
MYFPNGGSGEERHLFKMNFLEFMLPYFKKLAKEKPLILTGDFNIAHKAIDIHDPVRLDGESGFKPEERQWMDKLVDAGFVDLYRHFNPSTKDAYSWWSYRQGSRKRNKGWRIDYFFATQDVIPLVKEIRMDTAQEGSDHCPLVLVVGVKP